MTPEQAHNVKSWIAALRSGNYRQTQNTLKSLGPNGPSYCCLGVLCEVVGLESLPAGSNTRARFTYGSQRLCLVVPQSAFEQLTGLTELTVDALVILNDSMRIDFIEISDVIQAAYDTQTLYDRVIES